MKKTKVFAVVLAFILLTAGIVLMSGKTEKIPAAPDITISEPDEDTEKETGWKLENDFFTVRADDIWKQETYKYGKYFYYLGVSYSDPQSRQESKVWADFQAEAGSPYGTGEDYINSLFGPPDVTPDIERSTGDFHGYQAAFAEVIDAAGYCTKLIVFNRGVCLYSIVTCVPIGDKKVQADIDKLLEDFVIGPDNSMNIVINQTED